MSTGAIIALAGGGTLLVAAGLIWMVLWLRRSYLAEEKVSLARLHEELPKRGWTFAERDDSILEFCNRQYRDYYRPNPFQPFVGPPKVKAAHNVITGIHRGRPFLAAVLDSYFRGEHAALRCIWVRTPAIRPGLSVHRAPALASTVNTALGWTIRSGDPEFDRKFQISADDEAFAATVLNPALTRFLLADEREFRGFQLVGDQFDVMDPINDHRDPAELIPALDLRCDILDRIPSNAWA
ncbi:hypothetical protein [Amycolatopsis taiwanensis]|uniref:DUF3137 domain-containing protein n=1 Tax=Amycolatopsis taiwanensis TaxID=342230 RepID=A0A9W6R3M4_9PSEU|nr:hypothetical protein [Amycolatopsis taiwanensis]GLY67037.1 hypothetical protein Atai01_36560 [Amycolatopsis taiwanensis]